MQPTALSGSASCSHEHTHTHTLTHTMNYQADMFIRAAVGHVPISERKIAGLLKVI